MAHWSTIQDAIVAKLQTISSVKNVKKNWQREIDPVRFEDAFTVAVDNDATQRRVHTWLVAWVGATPNKRHEALTTYNIQYRYEIHGYLNFMQDSDSEHIIRDIVDEILTAFIPYNSLGLDGNATTPVQAQDITVDMFDIDQFGDVMCSHVKLSMTVTVFQGNITYT